MIVPQIGMGATIAHYSDRTACTIIDISKSGKIIHLQEDTATRTDSNGMSDSQIYYYQSNPDGQIYKATLRKDNKFKISGSTGIVVINKRDKFFDYSF